MRYFIFYVKYLHWEQIATLLNWKDICEQARLFKCLFVNSYMVYSFPIIANWIKLINMLLGNMIDSSCTVMNLEVEWRVSVTRKKWEHYQEVVHSWFWIHPGEITGPSELMCNLWSTGRSTVALRHPSVSEEQTLFKENELNYLSKQLNASQFGLTSHIFLLALPLKSGGELICFLVCSLHAAASGVSDIQQ